LDTIYKFPKDNNCIRTIKIEKEVDNSVNRKVKKVDKQNKEEIKQNI